MMNNSENNNKKRKDQFSVTIIGVIIYSILLILIMAGTYIGVKSIIKNHEKKAENVSEEPKTEEVKKVEEPVEEEIEETKVTDELNEHSIDLSSVCDSNTRYIDYTQTLFTPSKRDKSLVWQDNVFSRIENTEHPSEALVNTFSYKKVYGYLMDGTKIVLNVYTNPETEMIEKIKAVSYKGDGVEVTTYYYNLGNVNYITQYRKGTDTPINIGSSEIESRYYFSNDEMVKYIYCSNDVATEYSVADIDTYSEGTVGQYDYLEGSMLNCAYINYNIAKGLPETESINGYVLDEFNQPLKNASVTITRDTDGETVAETTTSEDGFYSAEIENTDDSKFTITVTDPTLCEVKIYNVTAVHGSGDYYAEPVYMSYEGNVQEYSLQILVRDATDMAKALANAVIKFRNGLNNTDGEVFFSGSLNEAGAMIFPVRAGCYTAEVSLGGYETAYFSVVVKQDHQAVLGYAVPDLAENTFATILSWDTTPLDLDARVIASNASRVMKSPSDSIGSTTPEVIYVENSGTDEYNYFVSDYTACTVGDPLSYNMSSSNATVTVYDADGIVTAIHVPLAHSGVVWDVLKIRNNKVVPNNQYYYNFDDNSYWTSK